MRILLTYLFHFILIGLGMKLCYEVWAVFSGKKPLTDGKSRIVNCPQYVIYFLVLIAAVVPFLIAKSCIVITIDIASKHGQISDTVLADKKSDVISWLPGGYLIFQKLDTNKDSYYIVFYPHVIKGGNLYEITYGRSSHWITEIKLLGQLNETGIVNKMSSI